MLHVFIIIIIIIKIVQRWQTQLLYAKIESENDLQGTKSQPTNEDILGLCCSDLH